MSALNILLVEDHDEWLKILYERVKNAVEKMGLQPNITIAKTFDVAWKKLETKEFWHLLITDIGLGGAKVSHQKLGKQLVERARNQEMPCIVVSGTPQITPGDVSILYEKLGVNQDSNRSFR
jgi:CheY-like chemotaxis protein